MKNAIMKEHHGFKYAFSASNVAIGTERWIIDPSEGREAYAYLESKGLTIDIINVTNASFKSAESLQGDAVIISGLGFESIRRSDYVKEILSASMRKQVVMIEDPGYAIDEQDMRTRYGEFITKQITTRFKNFSERRKQ